MTKDELKERIKEINDKEKELNDIIKKLKENIGYESVEKIEEEIYKIYCEIKSLQNEKYKLNKVYIKYI